MRVLLGLMSILMIVSLQASARQESHTARHIEALKADGWMVINTIKAEKEDPLIRIWHRVLRYENINAAKKKVLAQYIPIMDEIMDGDPFNDELNGIFARTDGYVLLNIFPEDLTIGDLLREEEFYLAYKKFDDLGIFQISGE